MNSLNKKIGGKQFKGVSVRDFCLNICTYFLPNFRQPILFVPDTDNLLDKAEIRFGDRNVPELKMLLAQVIVGDKRGLFYVTTSEGRRKFKTLIPNNEKVLTFLYDIL